MKGSKKYTFLRAIASILRWLGWILLAVGIIGAIVVASSTGGGDSFTRAIGSVGSALLPILGIVWFIQLYSLGSILMLLIEIEQNTRALAE
jgi:hypothetical protein